MRDVLYCLFSPLPALMLPQSNDLSAHPSSNVAGHCQGTVRWRSTSTVEYGYLHQTDLSIKISWTDSILAMLRFYLHQADFCIKFDCTKVMPISVFHCTSIALEASLYLPISLGWARVRPCPPDGAPVPRLHVEGGLRQPARLQRQPGLLRRIHGEQTRADEKIAKKETMRKRRT